MFRYTKLCIIVNPVLQGLVFGFALKEVNTIAIPLQAFV